MIPGNVFATLTKNDLQDLSTEFIIEKVDIRDSVRDMLKTEYGQYLLSLVEE